MMPLKHPLASLGGYGLIHPIMGACISRGKDIVFTSEVPSRKIVFYLDKGKEYAITAGEYRRSIALNKNAVIG